MFLPQNIGAGNVTRTHDLLITNYKQRYFYSF